MMGSMGSRREQPAAFPAHPAELSAFATASAPTFRSRAYQANRKESAGVERRITMDDDLMDRCCADDGEPSTAPGGMPADGSTPVSLLPTQMCSEMSISVLAAHCLREINNYRRCEPYTEMYGMELFCRATVQGNQEARACVQHCFHE